MQLKERNEIDEKYKFDLSEYCLGEKDFYDRCDKISKEITKISDYKGKLGDIDTLLEFEQFNTKIGYELDTLYSYAFYLVDVDSSNNNYQKMFNLIRSIYIKNISLSSFVSEEIKNLGEEYLRKVIADDRFVDYKVNYIDLIRHLPHLLNENESYLTSQMVNFVNYDDMFTVLLDNEIKFDDAIDSEGEKHNVSPSTYTKLMRQQDRALRQSAKESYIEGLYRHRLSLFSYIYNSLKCDDFMTKLTKYDGVLESQFYGLNADIKIFDKVISEAKKHTDLVEKFRQAQARGLNLDKIEPCDTKLNVSKFNEKVTFDCAIQKMRGGFNIMGDVYTTNFERAIRDRWCDIYPNKNKSSSIYCGNTYKKHPVMHFNWLDEAGDMLTFAHEFGHAMQDVITSDNQPITTSNLPFVVVEVPSLTSETVMFKYLLNSTDNKEEKLVYLQSFIETFLANVYSGCKLAEFEYYLRTQIQSGEILDVEEASNKYLEILKNYTCINYEDKDKYSWLSDGHIFRSYYNYNYSIAMVVASYFAKGIYENNDKIKNDFYQFMANGSSLYATDNLKKCGIDLLDDKVYEDAFSFFEEVVNEFDKLIENRSN